MSEPTIDELIDIVRKSLADAISCIRPDEDPLYVRDSIIKGYLALNTLSNLRIPETFPDRPTKGKKNVK